MSDTGGPIRTSSIERLAQDRPLLPFLPLVYVAWADGELSSAEIGAVAAQIEAQGGLDAGCRRRLAGWLNPADPPSPRELGAILRTVRQIAPKLPDDARESLAELGCRLLEIDAAAVDGSESQPPGAAVVAALGEMEAALGLAGVEAARGLLSPQRPDAGDPAKEDSSFPVPALQAFLDRPYGEVRHKRGWER